MPRVTHEITVEASGNVCKATVTIAAGLNETDIPYVIIAPSQTLLCELIKLVLPRRGK